MDRFKEQIIKKQPTNKDNLTRIFIMLAALALAFAVIFISLMFPNLFVIGFTLAIGAVYGGFYLMKNLDIEYEYIFTNGDLDVDKIMAARSRKRLITIKVNDVTDIGPCEDHDDGGRTVVMASAYDPESQDYFMDLKHASYGETRVIFTPDDEMLRMIKTSLPRSIRNKVDVPDRPEDEED
ncbi:MAG: hypothetical protein IJ806_11070 [Ruminococcus sp.]|nr:hypothetical protein [Ruminococcus sp.]